MDDGRCFHLLCLTVILSLSIANSIPVNSRFAFDDNSTTTDIINHLRRNSRNTKERPGEASGKPDLVNVSLDITDVRAISEVDSEISYDMHFLYMWQDERVKYQSGPESIIVDFDMAKSLFWFPDLFFTNSHQTAVQKTHTPTVGVIFKRDGTFIVSSQLTLVAHCDMDLANFPLDIQRCGFSMESYMYHADQVTLVLKATSASPSANHPVFNIGKMFKYSKTQIFSTGNYSSVEVAFELTRDYGHYVLVLYLPTFLLVCLSCLVFWLPPAALMERTIYSVFLLFCLVPMLVGSQYGAPMVGYMKAIDIWMISCFFFMAVAVFEVMLLHLVFGRDLLSQGQTGDRFELMRDEGANKNVPIVKIGPVVIQPDLARKIDIALRVIYPAAFALFNAVYWGTYTKSRPE